MKNLVSPNFSLAEVERSQTAARLGIDNTLPAVYYQNAINLALAVLEPVRNKFGAFSPQSWYRCEALNNAIGGSEKSQHSIAAAADIEIKGADNLALATWIRDNLAFDQLILEFYERDRPYSGWVHVSFMKGKNRNQCLTSPNGKIFYGGLGDA